MFGVAGLSGDTSGYGGLVASRLAPAGPSAALRRLLRRGRPTAGRAYPRSATRSSGVVDRGELTLPRRPRAPARLRPRAARRRRPCGSRCARRLRRALPEQTGRELHAVYHLLSITHNRRIRSRSRCRTTTRTSRRSSRSTRPRLARARDLGLLRHHLRRPPGADPDPDARRLARATRSARTTRSAASRWSTRAPRSRRRTSGGRTTDDDVTDETERRRRRFAGSRRAETTEGRVFTSPAATGTRSLAATTRSASRANASSSTWARSTRRRTACCG
jgi:hypothetical protein